MDFTPTRIRAFRCAARATLIALVIAGSPAAILAQSQDPAQKPQKPPATQQAEEGEKKRAAVELTIHERIMVIGDADRVREIPGSAHFLSLADLERQSQAFDDINRMLRQLPGVNIQEEEGFGLRPNIGLRGSGSERSAKITLMEDGVLIAPAPYAAPAAYYFPTAGRMEAIEVRKGSSQVKYGPRTTGGAINLMSTSIPRQFDVRARLVAGAFGTARALLDVGGSGERHGWLLETYQIRSNGFKELDGGGDTGYDLHDYLAKFRLNTDANARVYQDLEVKLGLTRQTSHETYLGLTDADFRANPLRRYAASQQDVFRSDHQQYQLRHFAALAPSLDVTTVIYRNDFARNWYKLQGINGVGLTEMFDDPAEFAGELAIAKGADSDADALKVRANNRDYYGQGVQSVVGWRPETGALSNQFELGIRYHVDAEDRFQHEDGYRMLDGRMALTSSGAPGSQSNRVNEASAWAVFVQDQISWGRWAITPGVRFEAIALTRTDYASDDPGRSSPTRVRTNQVDVAVPGIGVSYDASAELQVFGGVHRGFAPPGPGTSEFTEAEQSVNYELGVRYDRHALSLDVVGFFNAYSNLLGVDTLASGGRGTGDLFNGGAVNVAGLEASARFELVPTAGWVAPLYATYTYTDGTFQHSFSSDYGPWGEVEVGDKLPYLSEHQLSAGIGVVQGRWNIDLQATYSSAMRTEASQGPIDPRRSTDAFLVWDLSANFRVADSVVLYAAVENLTDNLYIVARRPAGSRPGLPRTALVGARLDF